MKQQKAIILTSLLFLAACGQGSSAPVPGKYEFWQGPRAHLELRKNLTYQLCVGSKPCETGTYDFEILRSRPDGMFQICDARNPNLCGRPFGKEHFVDVTQIFFDPGVKGPMKKFNHPPDGKIVNGRGEDITVHGSETATIEYDWSGQPSFTFTDPDSGLYFRRTSD